MLGDITSILIFHPFPSPPSVCSVYVGGIAETYDVQKTESNLFVIMLKSFERKAMMSCAIEAGDTPEQRLSNGLVMGHAYSVTAVKLVHIERLNGKIVQWRLLSVIRGQRLMGDDR